MQFQIQEPTRELTDGYFTLGLKYSVLTLIGWMIGVMIVCTYPCFTWSGDKYPPMLVFLNDHHIMHIIASTFLIFFFSRYQFKKYELGLITNFEFNEKEKSLTLSKINTLNGKLKKHTISYSSLKITKEVKKGKLIGEQTIYHFYNLDNLVSSFNVIISPWKKHEKFNELIDQLDEIVLKNQGF